MSTWNCSIRLDPAAVTRPGTLAHVCGIFTERGISLHALSARGKDDDNAVIELTFATSPSLAAHLARRLQRLAHVRSVAMEPQLGIDP